MLESLLISKEAKKQRRNMETEDDKKEDSAVLIFQSTMQDPNSAIADQMSDMYLKHMQGALNDFQNPRTLSSSITKLMNSVTKLTTRVLLRDVGIHEAQMLAERTVVNQQVQVLNLENKLATKQKQLEREDQKTQLMVNQVQLEKKKFDDYKATYQADKAEVMRLTLELTEAKERLDKAIVDAKAEKDEAEAQMKGLTTELT